MKINYRVRKAVRQIKESLACEYMTMAKHACNYVGKEFNTTMAWKEKGIIEGLEEAKRILWDNNLDEYC